VITLLQGLRRLIQKVKDFNRTDVYKIAKGLGDLKQWELLANYADFVYYLSDALTHKSEGILPQENLIDFSLSDMTGGHTQLTDMVVLPSFLSIRSKQSPRLTSPLIFWRPLIFQMPWNCIKSVCRASSSLNITPSRRRLRTA
jgi:hypothetical protein